MLGLTLQVVRAADGEDDLRRRRRHEMRQRRRAERELAHQALHDRLTDLPNRTLMRDRTQSALERARSDCGFVAELFIDIDHFKVANDSLDHTRGDQLLVMIAGRLSAVLAADGTVDDEWNDLDIEARLRERRALAGEFPGEEESVGVYTREGADFEVHDLYVMKIARFGLLADLVYNAKNDR